MNTSVQAFWLGHSAFKLVSPDNTHILVDPFLSNNPNTPEEWKNPSEVDYIFLTHGHEDHVGDTLEIANETGCTVVAPVELSRLLTSKHGLSPDQAVEFNKGGTVEYDDFSVTMVSANHSSSYDGDYAGEPAGLIFQFDEDISIYHLGDTNVFYDLQLYGDMYEPEIALIPIGDHYTMDPGEAAVACELLRPDIAVPIHYGTFPVLTGDPNEFKDLTESETGTKVIIPETGENFLLS